MSPRYAIYYAPPRDGGLSRRAAAWLGRDAWTGEAVPRTPPPILSDLDLDGLTADPRGYGFHATIRAPFELSTARGETELLAAAERFAGGLKAFRAPMAPASLGRFLAFRLTADSPEMAAFHAASLEAFEPFRAPLSDFDLARRRKASLTPVQDARLVRWGYPYVLEDFRFHMTLTGSIADDAVRGRLLEALTDIFAEDIGDHLFDGVAVFRQSDRSAPFTILERFAFGARVTA